MTLATRLKITAIKQKIGKIAIATLLAQYILAGTWLILEKNDLLDWLMPKTTIIYIAKAEQPQVVESKAGDDINMDNINRLADIIHLKESTKGQALQGLHVTCKKKGLSNEYGYNPPNCYKNYEEVRKIVINWIIKKKAIGLSDNQLLCYYNTGKITDYCNYISDMIK